MHVISITHMKTAVIVTLYSIKNNDNNCNFVESYPNDICSINNNSITRQNDFQNRQKMFKKSKKCFLNGAAFKTFKALKLSEGPPRRLI